MSENFCPTQYNEKALQKQLLNTIIGNHDLICGCNSATTHLAALIFEQASPTNFTNQQKKTIKQCLGEDHTTTDIIDEEDGGFSAGDLEQLFAEDDGDEG